MMLTFEQFTTLSESTYETFEDARKVIHGLRHAGFKGYLVGGCVRDLITGHTPKDFDVATDATPDEVLKVFPKGELVGKKFGVVIVNGIDVATFRKDGTYSDGRRPDSVEFTRHPHDDASRRDFTVNALFMDPDTKEVLDFHGGLKDAKDKVLRAVGNPHDRFSQDYLRMLRADRFAAKLDFTIHPDTHAAMTTHAPSIRSIDVERQHDELTKSLALDPSRVMNSMMTTGLFLHVFPEMAAVSHSDLEATKRTVAAVGRNVGLVGCAAVFMRLPLGTVNKMLRRLKFHNDEIKHITSVLDLQDRITNTTMHSSLDKIKRLVREEFFRDALKLYGARVHAHDPHANAESFTFLSHMAAKLSHGELHPTKFITGDDLIALGMKPGKDFARILTAAENGQLSGDIKSKEQALAMVKAGHL